MYRENYRNIKTWYLEAEFDWCQNKFRDGVVQKWQENESEWGGASYDFEDSYENNPIECLMYNVVKVITYSGRFKVAHEICLNRINTILSQHSLDELIKDLDEEKKEFLYDLNIVLNNQELEE